MLDEQARKVTRPEPKSIGQSIDAYPIKSPTLDKNQSALDGRLGALPRRAKRGRFGTTSEARAKAGTLGSCRTPIERYIASKWRSRRADRSAIDARSFNPDEHHTIPGGVAAAKGIITERRSRTWTRYSGPRFSNRGRRDDHVRKRPMLGRCDAAIALLAAIYI